MPLKTYVYINNANKVWIGYACAFLLLLTSLGLAHYITKKLIDQTNDVADTNAIINNLEQSLSYIKDAETGVRGYFLMKDSVFLEPYRFSRKKVDSLYTILTQQMDGNPRQNSQLTAINTTINRRFQILHSSIDTFIKYDRQTEIFLKKSWFMVK